MDLQRKAELMLSLRTLLEEETKGQDNNTRLGWLLDHLKEYLARWSGWLALDTMNSILQNDLHAVLTNGIDLVDEYLAGQLAGAVLTAKWQAFATSVRNINKDTHRDIAADLKKKLDDVYAAYLHQE